MSKYSGIERPCLSSLQLLLVAIIWRSCENCASTILLLWKVRELTNSVSTLSFPPSLSGDLNSRGTPFPFFVFILGCAAFPFKLYLLLNIIFSFYVGFFSAFLTLLQSKFLIHPILDWLFTTLAIFNDFNLAYCCLKDIFFSCNLSRSPRNPNLLISFHQLNYLF